MIVTILICGGLPGGYGSVDLTVVRREALMFQMEV
jgi:hypothetical protein